MIIAHTKNKSGQRQGLEEHLRNVADRAASSACAFGAQDVAKAVALLHDIGKYHAPFQMYLLEAEKNPRKPQRRVDHKMSGACYAASTFAGSVGKLLALIIAGHHGGLPQDTELMLRLKAEVPLPHHHHNSTLARHALPELASLASLCLPSWVQSELQKEFFTRMVFSALVDADFLDTEKHFLGTRLERRNRWTLEHLWERFCQGHASYTAHSHQSESLLALRQEIYHACLDAAVLPPGFFRLTVPTGGGKTLSSLAFALKHALHHGYRRIVYAIPYTSIIDQTARVFFDLFGDEQAYLEHHSNIVIADPDQPTPVDIWRRLASENWDVPLVLSTTVQLFESLLSRHPSSCRKLHNLAQSVIVLDEVQMLPVHLLATILDVLQQLVEHYQVTVLLCTATQPDFTLIQKFPQLHSVREIAPDPHRAFTQLQRVQYTYDISEAPWTWSDLAQRVCERRQALVILNTRADALQAYDALLQQRQGDSSYPDSLFHLSTRLCGAHRRDVLQEVMRRLRANESCHLVATQVVEAGVDIDFPCVFRALGPLDRIVQAAGRANRHGLLQFNGQPTLGEVIIFELQEGRIPKDDIYKLATDITRRILRECPSDLHHPDVYHHFFRECYANANLDAKNIEALRQALNYPEVEQCFRMIEDKTISVIVPYPVAAPSDESPVQAMLKKIRQASVASRAQLRALQPYIVNIPSYELPRARERGLVHAVLDDLWEWDPVGYDARLNGRGILLDATHDCVI